MTVENENQEQQRKYAGKFDTIEQLEEGYKNAAKVYQENEQLKKQVEVPVDYLIPDGIQLDEDSLGNIKQLAKNAGLSQQHFNKLLAETAQTNARRAQQREEAIKSVGEDKVNLIKDYLKSTYPTEIAEEMFDRVVANEKLRNAALSHREKLLSSRVPGVDAATGNINYRVTMDDVLKAREQMSKAPGNKAMRDNYIRLNGMYAKQKQG